MKIGIMGGTFDPVHLGHMVAAETARESMKLDEIWFLPVNVPPHKENTLGATALQRFEMVNLSVAGHPCFQVKDLELKLGGTSFTIDTVAVLHEQYSGHQFAWIIGADMIQYLPHWHQIERLAGLITFIGLSRQGYSTDVSNLAASVRDRISLVEMPRIEISSTEIREKCRQGKSIRFLVSDPVRIYIEEQGLYGP